MILVFGKTGQVARELSRFDDVHCAGRDEADLGHPETCADLIERCNWEAVINAAAYTAVDKAESEAAIAHVINGDSPTAMAKACAKREIPFVHISTDYVFEGNGENPWVPNDAVCPQSVYGASKLAGEMGVVHAHGIYAILRTSWVFSEHGHNFVKTMLRLGAERAELNIVADQIGGPTPARAIAAACHQMAKELNKESSGIYHFSGAPDCSWAEFATEIFAQAQLTCQVNGIATRDYPTAAKRPLNSRLNCEDLWENFAIERPVWREGLYFVKS